MKNLLSLIVVVIMLSCNPLPFCESCTFDCLEAITEDVITNECFQNYECSFDIEEGKRLIQDSLGTLIDDDDYMVFSIYTHTNGSPNIADDEFTNRILIEVEENVTSFNYENMEIAEHVTSNRTCFCWDRSIFRTTEVGCIQGEKIGLQWYLQGNIELEAGPTYQFELSF